MSDNVLDAAQPLLNGHSTKNNLKTRVSTARARLIRWLEHPGTAQLVVCALAIGVACGFVAFCYDFVLNHFLDLVWSKVPNDVVLPVWHHAKSSFAWWPEQTWLLGLYIAVITTLFGVVVGASQTYLGCPGDLPETISSFHEQGFVPYSQAPSMLVCSLFSVCAGGSLGPEAPLLCLCASTVSYLFQEILPVKPAMLRYCSLMGMAAGLAAFFGVTMGGALFAMEVPHRMGLEYFEVTSHALAAGAACLAVFRALFGFMPFGDIWQWPVKLLTVDSRHVVTGAVVGALAAAVAIGWTYATKAAKRALARVGLDEHSAPTACGALGGFVIAVTGMLLPPTMFWGEFELRSMADPTIPLPHIWPRGGVWSVESFHIGDWSAGLYASIGVVKLFAISVTLFAGFRGGFIFPLFACGACLGTALHMVLAQIFNLQGYPAVLFAMAGAAGLNTSITRTPLGTTIILTTLCGQPGVAVPCLAAALVALFATKSTPFIMSQRSRADVETSLSCSSKEPYDRREDHHDEHVAAILDVTVHTPDEDHPGPANAV